MNKQVALSTQTTAERVCAQCKHQLSVQGYVRFSDIAKVEGLSRQRIDQALRQAVEKGLISEDQRILWRHSYKLGVARLDFAVTHSNLEWLKQQGEELNLSVHDVLNRVLHTHIHSQSTHASLRNPQP